MKRHFVRTNLFPLLAFLVVSFIVITVSCRKTETTAAISVSNDESSIQFRNTTNFAFQNESLDDDDLGDADGSDCATVTNDPSKDVYPHTKTITYNNCTDNCKGRLFNGTKIVQYYVDPETAKPGDLLKEVTYEDFIMDSVKVSGDIKVYLVSDNPWKLHVVATRTYVIPGKDGVTKTFKGDHYRTLTAGGDTEDNSDDVYTITGTSSGNEILHGGTVAKYTTVIDENDPVMKESDCCWCRHYRIMLWL